MKRRYSFVICILFVIVFLAGCSCNISIEDNLPNGNNTDAKVILLYGQSNASGCSSIHALEQYTDTYNKYTSKNDNVWIKYIVDNGTNTSSGVFVNAGAGQGVSEYYFGPELGMSKVLSDNFNDENVFIIKYTWSGSNLDNQWLDGNYMRGNFYNNAKSFTIGALDQLKSKGYNVDVKAVCWMQGESDANDTLAPRYYENTKRFVRYIREDLEDYSNNIYFIDAGISEVWNKYIEINESKQYYANEDDYAIFIDTISMGLTTSNEPANSPDIAHYDSMSEILLGKAFGDCIVNLFK